MLDEPALPSAIDRTSELAIVGPMNDAPAHQSVTDWSSELEIVSLMEDAPVLQNVIDWTLEYAVDWIQSLTPCVVVRVKTHLANQVHALYSIEVSVIK